MRKKILVFLVTIILLGGFVVLKQVKAGSGDNVYGWAWSENIGWISFNCDNPELASCSTSNYGVNIDSAGNFSGYAWAGGGENADGSLAATIGWISFDGAQLDMDTGEVSGWARALAYGDGWDGWIKLRGTWANGVSLNSASTPSELEGWAWGGDVIGWISFNCLNRGVCGVSNYKVMVNLSQSPDKPTTTTESWRVCGGIPEIAPRTSLILNWSYLDPQGGYEVWVDDDSDFSDTISVGKFNNRVEPGPCLSSDCSYTLNLDDDDDSDWLSEFPWGVTYWWKVRVKDINDNWSVFSDTDSFKVPDRASPYVNFTADPINPGINEKVSFKDYSKCYLFDGIDNIKYDCKHEFKITGEDDISYEWDFDYDGSFDPSDFTKGDTFHTYKDLGNYIVLLKITDEDAGDIDLGIGICWEKVTLGIPLPEWREIPPF